MWVTFGHLRPSGHIMPDHAGDRGAVFLVLAPHDHPAYQAEAGVHAQADDASSPTSPRRQNSDGSMIYLMRPALVRFLS